jgi:MHS family shikimate/dehydroshikimate transporter-like MFS transporter
MKPESSATKKVVFACAFGTLFEWYDFLIFGTAAALVFGKLFFPGVDPISGILLSLMTFSLGFIARPLGAVLFGHFGDRYGRKNTLMATMLLMGISTFLIGLLPTYAQIGFWAPVLLVVFRLLQGIAFGGEWGGASTVILESVPKKHRGFYSSFVQVGYPAGLLMASGIFYLVTLLPDDQLMQWGWRLPFLLSLVLVLIGHYTRKKISETPEFLDIQKQHRTVAFPIVATLKRPGTLITGIGLKITEVTWAYLLSVFMVMYAVQNLDLSRSDAMGAVLIASAINLIAIPLFGSISDRVGRSNIYILGSIMTVVMAWPIFWMLSSGYFLPGIVLGMVLGNALMMAPLAAYLTEIFPAKIRFTGASLGCQIAAAIGGGIVPPLAIWMTSSGDLSSLTWLMIGLGIITLLAALNSKYALKVIK